MQGEFGAFKRVKKKLTKLKTRDGEEEAEDLPEDSDREISQRKIKQKLVKLREKFGEEIYEDSELAKARLKHRIAKLGEKLKKDDRDDDDELFEDADDKEKTGMRIKERIVKLGEKLRRDDDYLDDDEGKKSTSVKFKHKIAKISEKLRKEDDDDEDGEKLGTGKIIKTKLTKISERLRHKDDDGDDDEIFEDCYDETEKEKQSLKEKLVKFSEILKKDDNNESYEDVGPSDDKLPRKQKGKFAAGDAETTNDPEDKSKTSTRIKQKIVKLFESDRTSLDFEFEDSSGQSPVKSFKRTRMKIFSDKIKKEDADADKDSLSTEDEREPRQSKLKGFMSKLKSEEELGESSDPERRLPDDVETVSQSGSEGRAETIDLHGSEGNLLEKLGQRLKERSDKVQRYFQRSNKLGEVNRRLKSQIWSSVVTIVLVEGKNLQAMDIDGFSDPYVKFRLGNEKYKSKVIYKNLNPSWLEQFDLHLYDDQNQELEVTVWDKDRSRDDFMGRCSIDLAGLEREKTHGIWQDLEEGAGSIHLLLTISGTTASETISDLTTYEENPRERTNIESRYALRNTLHNLRDVGHLTVKVYRATGLAAADLGGKSDPFCVLELVNARLQTQTEYKTLSPSWQKIFTFNVKDINSVLEVTVFDEDRDHKVEFLGKTAIPLLRVRNGEKRWYCLKDKKLHARAKGNCPMILLEMHVVWNPVRAWIRTLNPKEEKYMQAEVKFKRQVFVRNVLRLKAIIMTIIEWGKFIQDCFEWERPATSAVALVLFIALCYYFEPWMIPAALLIVFLKYYIVLWLTGGWSTSEEDEEPVGEDEEDDDDKDKEEKKSLKERLQAIQEVTQTVQNAIGYIASLGEQVKNTFNFTVPFVSYLAMGLVLAAMLVMYFIPVRYLIMLGGINKFARKLIRPHTIPNNEVLDLLSRVPDDEDLIAFRELRPYQSGDVERRREQRKKHKSS